MKRVRIGWGGRFTCGKTAPTAARPYRRGLVVILLTAGALAGCRDSSPGARPTAGSGGNGGTGGDGSTGATTGAAGSSGGNPDNPDVGASCVGAPVDATSSIGTMRVPQLGIGPTVTAAVAPPAISGGTLRVLADRRTVVAADADRDQVYLIDLPARTLRATVPLNAGDEPGRVVEDGAGRVHVALRRGGAVVTIDPVEAKVLEQRAICAAPRGIAYDPATDLLHVACAGGELVSLPAGGGAVVRKMKLDPDLRDVIVEGSTLRVSRFRSAELLTVDREGHVVGRTGMPTFRSIIVRQAQQFSAAVAWRTVAIPGGGVAMLHQRGLDDEILQGGGRPGEIRGGYGGKDTCGPIVHTAVTEIGADGSVQTGPALGGLPVAVDLAISDDGNNVAVVSAGNAHPLGLRVLSGATGGGVHVTGRGRITDGKMGCRPDADRKPCDIDWAAAADGKGPKNCAEAVPAVQGEPVAVAFTAEGFVIVQSREPAVLNVPGGDPIVLSPIGRADTGHLLFHANAGGALACASCHAEGSDDGRVWNFACAGARRTQSLQTGVRGSEPFHWTGDEKDFPTLVQDVFSTRMSGPDMAPDQADATLAWIDAQPRVPRAAARDAAAVARGQALFNDTTRAGCSVCHAGPRFTNNQNADVGTGGKFQVSSLVGLVNRAPFMHNGCAKTLRDRFSSACGGGDKHGAVSSLSAADIDDLVTFLETL